jgi:hypothetical protein
MARTALTDQLGAIRLIDDLRHRQLLVKEHLDLPARRNEVAQRIRDYYLLQNVVVDDETVEWAVREHFDKRLVFEAPAAVGWRERLALAYVERRRQVPVLLALLAAGIAALVFFVQA